MKGVPETLEELRQNHPAIPPGSEKGSLRQFVGDLAGSQAVCAGAALYAGAEGQGHIGPGVAVGNRKHIQGVDNVPVLFQPVKGRRKGMAQFGAGQSRILY